MSSLLGIYAICATCASANFNMYEAKSRDIYKVYIGCGGIRIWLDAGTISARHPFAKKSMGLVLLPPLVNWTNFNIQAFVCDIFIRMIS